MAIDWTSYLIAWVGGIPFGVFGSWLFAKLTKKGRPEPYSNVTYNIENIYSVTTYVSDDMHFEPQGRPSRDVEVDRIIEQLFRRRRKRR